jgi:hypothetical protein
MSITNIATGYSFSGITNNTSANLDDITITNAEIANLNNSVLTNCTVAATGTTALGIPSKSYVDTKITSNIALCAKLNSTNSFNNTNYFNDYVEFNDIVQFDDYVEFNKEVQFDDDITINATSYFNDNVNIPGSLLLGNLNVTYSAIFGGICPASTVTPTTNNHLCRLRYLNDNFVKLNANQSILGNTTISGNVVFSNYLPTANIAPVSLLDLCNKDYVDNSSHSIQNYAKLNFDNTFNAINTFVGNVIISGNLNTSNNVVMTGNIISSGNVVMTGNITSSGVNTFTAAINNFTQQIVVGQITLNNDRVRLGQSSVVSADQGIAIGENASCTSISSICIGAESVASGLTGENVALGYQAKAQDIECVAIGAQAEANHFLSTAIGFGCVTTEDYQTRIGIPGQLGQITNTYIATDRITNRLNNPICTFSDCGVWFINTISGSNGPFYPLFKSVPNLSNFTSQSEANLSVVTTGLTNPSYGPPQGQFVSISVNDSDDFLLIYPLYGIVGYQNANYGGLIRINYQNNTTEVKTVRAVGSLNDLSSVRVFYRQVQL